MKGSGDHEALMAALMANPQLLEAKVAINNAILTANDVATSQPGDFFVVGECDGQKTIDGEQVPLVLTPSGEGEAGGTGYERLVAALQAEREWLDGKVVANSAVLLRGFGVREAAEFDAVVEALGWPDIRYVGPAPRTHVHGRVWTANEGPLELLPPRNGAGYLPVYGFAPFMVISLACGEHRPIYGGVYTVGGHDEGLYYPTWVAIKEFPEKVILFCEVPPPEGGETLFVPSFRVTERALEEFPEMVEELDVKGLRYTFTAPSNNNTGSMRGRGRGDAFATSNKTEAEKRVKALGMDVEWLPDGGVKTILGPHPLTRVFPGRKGRKMWFNTVVGMHGKELSSATAADGGEIPASFVQRCEEIIEEESIQFRWRKGDILILDNLATLHGRRPSLPPRRVLVATCK